MFNIFRKTGDVKGMSQSFKLNARDINNIQNNQLLKRTNLLNKHFTDTNKINILINILQVLFPSGIQLVSKCYHEFGAR